MNEYVLVLFIAVAVVSYIVQLNLRRKFEKYSEIPLSSGMTGAEVAERMLRQNGINDVKVTAVRGQLTDHFNPLTKSVNLSEGVYHSNSVAAAA